MAFGNDFNMKIGVTADVDPKKLQAEIDKNTKNIDINVNVKADKTEAQKAVQKVFDKDKLDKQGREYFTKTTGILKQVKDYYKKNGAVSIDISNQQKANGQIKSFTATVTEATGVIKKFNYERGKINTGGAKANYGFVQTDNVGVLDKLSGSKLKQTDDFLAKISNRISDINSKTYNQSKPLLSVENSDKYNTALTTTQGKITAITNSTKILSDDHKREIGTMIADLDRYRKELQNVEYAGTTLKPDTFTDTKAILQSQLGTTMQKWDTSNLFDGQFKTNVLQAKQLLDSATNPEDLDKYRAKLKLLTEDFKQLNTANKNSINGFKLDESKLQTFNKIGAYMSNNTRLTKAQVSALKELQGSIGNVNDKSGLDGIKNKFRTITSEAEKLGNTGNTVLTKLGKNSMQFLNYLGSATIIMTAINGIKNIVSEVKNIDSSMISLKKVTNETNATYDKFLTNTTQKAKELGASISDLVESTADFARLGYSLPDATKLAEVATLYKNVGDIDISSATTSIISTMKAFGYGADQAEKIVNVFNEVGNRFAISSAGIGESLQNSAAALMTANNTLEQSTALTVGANNVLQDPSAVGTLWKTVSMRIRGATSELIDAGLETDGLITSTSKLQEKIKDLTGGFDIMIDENTFKSTYDIIVGIGEEFSKLSDIKQAELLEILAGKRQGTGLASALNNVKDIKDAFDAASESANSARIEQQKHTEGVQYSLDRLKASFQELSLETLDSSTIKGFVDIANAAVNATSAVGGLVPVLSTLAVVYLSFTKNEKRQFLQNFIAGLFKIKVEAGATSLAVSSLSAVMSGGLFIAFSLITSAIYKAKQAHEEYIQATKKHAEESKTLTSEIDDLTSKYDELSEAIKTDASVKDDLITTQTELLTKLGLEGESIDTLIEKYGSLTEAIKQASLEQLKDSERSLRANYGNEKDNLIDTGGYKWSDNEQETISFSSKKHYDELMKLLKDAGLNVSDGENKNTGYFKFDGDIKTTAGVLKNYQDIKMAMDAISNSGIYKNTDSMLKLDLYTKLQDRYTELNTVVETYNSSISDLNTNLSQQQMLTALQGKELPKTKEEFTAFEDSLVKTAIASGKFVGSQEQIKASIENYLATQPEFISFFDTITISSDKSTIAIRSFKDALSDETATKAIDNFQSSMKSIQDALSSDKLSSSDIIDLMQQFSTFDWDSYGVTGVKGVGDLEGAFKALATQQYNALDVNIQNNASIKDLYNSCINTSEAVKTLSDSLSDLSSGNSLISDVTDEIKDTGKVSVESLKSIISTYNELTPVVEDYLSGKITEKELLSDLTNAYNADLSNYKQYYANKHGDDIDFYNQILTNIDDEVLAKAKGYGIDLENYKSLVEAKGQLEENLINNIKQKYESTEGEGVAGIAKSLEDAFVNSESQSILDGLTESVDLTVKTPNLTYKEDGGTSGSDNFSQSIDWATQSLQNLQSAVTDAQDNLSDTKGYDKQTEAVKALITAQEALKSGYDSAAKSDKSQYDDISGISKYKKLIEGGKTFTSSDFTDEDLYNKVKSAQDLWNSYQDNLDKVKSTSKEITDINKQKSEDSIKSKFDANENTFNLSDKTAKDKEKYYAELARLNDLYYKGNLDYADEYQSNLETLHNHEVELAEDAADKKVKANEDYIDSVISKFEKAQSNIDDIASNTEDGSTEQFSALTKGLESATNEAKYLESQITKLNKKYKNDKSNEDYISQLEDLTSKLGDAKDAMKSYQDSMVDNIKARYEEQKDAMTDAYDDEKEAIEDRYDTELDRLNEIVDAKKKSLQADKDAADYAKDIAEKTKDVADIDKRMVDLTKAANSGDREAIAELKELEEDRAKAQEELDDAQADHKLDVETDALDNLADNFEKQSEINKATDLASAKSIFDTKLANLTTLYKKEEELITQVSEYTKSAFTTALADVNSQITKLTGSASSTGSIDASSLYDNLTGINSNNTTSSTDSAILSILSNGKGTGAGTSKLNEYIKSNYNGSQLSYAQMASLASLLGMSGVSSKSIVGDSDTKDEILKKLKSAGFSSGGYVNAKSVGEDGFALVKHGEPILTVEQGKMFKELVGNLQPLNNLVKLSTPNLSNIVTNNNSAPIALAINVTGVNDKSLLANINSAGNDLLKNLSSEIRKLK